MPAAASIASSIVAARPATRAVAERSPLAAAASAARPDAHPPPTRQDPSGASSSVSSVQGRPQNGTRTCLAGMRRLYHRARAPVQSDAAPVAAANSPGLLDTIAATIVL